MAQKVPCEKTGANCSNCFLKKEKGDQPEPMFGSAPCQFEKIGRLCKVVPLCKTGIGLASVSRGGIF